MSKILDHFSNPHYKFDCLRRKAAEVYEKYADVGLNEWKTFRLEGDKVKLYINNQEHPFIVNKMKGNKA
jgi:hypothetical protein